MDDRLKEDIIASGRFGRELERRVDTFDKLDPEKGVTRPTGSEANGKVRALYAVSPEITAHSVSDAVQQGDVIVIAAHPDGTKDIVDHMGDVKGKIIIDCMNSVGTKAGAFASSAEALRTWTGNPDVVKCFNSTGFNVMQNPVFGEKQADMFMAGNSARGKEIARNLALDLGFEECYDLGGDDRIPILESFALLWIDLALFQGHGREIAFKLLKR